MTVATANGNGKHKKIAAIHHAPEAEKAVIRSVLSDPGVMALATETEELRPQHFFDDANRLLWAAMVEMRCEGTPIDPTTLAGKLRRESVAGKSKWDFIGPDYIHELLRTEAFAFNIRNYASDIVEQFKRRELERFKAELAEQLECNLPAEDIARFISDFNTRVKAHYEPQDTIGPPLSLEQMREQFPALNEPVIHGLLRKGESLNLIAATKVGKSWSTYEVAFRVATGGRLWDTFTCVPGKVLILDNELHPSVLTDRLLRVSTALGLEPSDWEGKIVAQSFRGRLLDIDGIYRWLKAFVKPGEYQLIIGDAYYRMLPTGTNENENGQITSVANKIDSLGREFDSATMWVHHSSKGNQSGKAVTDVGSGASAMSRAADTHLVLRPHEESGVVVMDAALRSWPPVEPLCLRWDFPLWKLADALDPSALKSEKPKVTINQVAESVLECLHANGPLTRSVIRAKLQKSGEKINQAVEVLLAACKIEPCDITTGRGTHTGYQVKTSTLDSLDSPTSCPTSSNVDGHP